MTPPSRQMLWAPAIWHRQPKRPVPVWCTSPPTMCSPAVRTAALHRTRPPFPAPSAPTAPPSAWLYSYYGKNFVKTIVNAGKKFGKLEVVNDQCGNPTNAVDLAHEILQLCVTHEYGLYHCTGEGICSWYDFASEIIRLSGVDAAVAPCTSEEYKAKHPESADRPKWSALDNRMLRCTVGNDVRDWKDALACFFTHWDGDNGMKD